MYMLVFPDLYILLINQSKFRCVSFIVLFVTDHLIKVFLIICCLPQSVNLSVPFSYFYLLKNLMAKYGTKHPWKKEIQINSINAPLQGEIDI